MRYCCILHFIGLQMFQLFTLIEGDSDIQDVILQFNLKHKTEINIFLNFQQGRNTKVTLQHFERAVYQLNHIPKLVATDVMHIQPLQKMFTEQCLTLAWMTWKQLNNTFAAIDRLLWNLHFKDIILIYHQPQQQEKELQTIFEMCWKHGFTSVLVWIDADTFFTYEPYPSLRVKKLRSIFEFDDKSHLNNFHLYNWPQPATHFPPRFGISTDRQGHHKYWGYLQKIISVFITHHNGTIRYYPLDLWGNTTQTQMMEYIHEIGFNFFPVVGYTIPQLAESYPLYLSRLVLMVPNAREIPESRYMIIAFNTLVWWVVLFTGFVLFLILIVVVFKETQILQVAKASMFAFSIIMFVAVPMRAQKSKLNFVLKLLFLFTGFFLTNYYSTSLSSLYTLKVYEPQLEYLTDIKRTNLRLFQHSIDLVHAEHIDNMPSFVRQRLYVGNNTELFFNRKNLNMTYMYSGLEDLIDYYMLQQIYLKKPIAKKPIECLYTQLHFVLMVNRSPLLEQFNRYLSHILEVGLFNKFMKDANLEGVLRGDLKILRDPEVDEALKLEYFRNSFVILMMGLIGALATFALEIVWLRARSLGVNWWTSITNFGIHQFSNVKQG